MSAPLHKIEVKPKADTLIIIPAFNEAESISDVIAGLRRESSGRFDILVINDGSRDETSRLAREAGAVCIDLPFNMGIGNAVHTGYMYAFRNGYTYAVQFDGDGQHPVDGVMGLIGSLQTSGSDIAIGSRFLNGEGYQSTAGRRAGIIIISSLIRLLTGRTVTDPTSGFRAVNRRALEVFYRYYPHDYPEPEAIVVGLKNGLKVIEIPALMRERQGGASSIRLFNSLYYMVKVSLAIWIKSLTRAGRYA